MIMVRGIGRDLGMMRIAVTNRMEPCHKVMAVSQRNDALDGKNADHEDVHSPNQPNLVVRDLVHILRIVAGSTCP